jgi:peptidoglycan-associated lipoprotein
MTSTVDGRVKTRLAVPGRHPRARVGPRLSADIATPSLATYQPPTERDPFMIKTFSHVRKARVPHLGDPDLGGLVLAASLAACGSSVKLDEAPVEDRNTSSPARRGRAGWARASTRAASPGCRCPAWTRSSPPPCRASCTSTTTASRCAASSPVPWKPTRVTSRPTPTARGARRAHRRARRPRVQPGAGPEARRSRAPRAVAAGRARIPDGAVSFGEEKPAAMGVDEGSYAKNRRVELTYR